MNQASNHLEYTRQLFKRISPWYDLVVFFLRPLRKRVVLVSGARGGMNVLDFACGTGEQSIAFARAGCSVVGVDLSEDMLSKARKKIKPAMDVSLACLDASSLSYKDGAFDISTISLGLHDMPREMAISVLKEMKRVAKNDGKIVIVEHYKASTIFGRFVHRIWLRYDSRYYPKFIETGLASYLHEVGLEPEKQFTAFWGILQVVVCPNT